MSSSSNHHPTLLKYPVECSISPMGFIEQELPGDPSSYRVVQVGKSWIVVREPDGVKVYIGPGPVEVLASPAPF